MPDLHVGPVNVATPTPLNADGELDRESLKPLFERWLHVGADGVLLLGSMGEGPLLSDATRDAFVAAAVEQVGDKLTLFASAADLSRARTIERARRYAGMGVHCAVLCLTPGVSPAKGIADVKAAADACPCPCAFYENPYVTGVSLVLDELLDVLAHPNIHACKDSSNNALIARALTAPDLRPKNVALLDGCEYQTVTSRRVGYDGVLHGGGALTGRWVRAIWDLAAGDDLAEAERLDRQKALFLATVYNRLSRPLQNTLGQKYALTLLGVLKSAHVLLEQALDHASRRRIEGAIDKWGEWVR